MRKAIAIIIVVLVYGLLGLNTASAEWYIAGYGGVAVTPDTDVDVTIIDVDGSLDTSGTFKDVDVDTSGVFGAKFGYFFSGFGLELEGYYFAPSAKQQTVQFTGTILDGTPVSGSTLATIKELDLDVLTIAVNGLYRFQLAKDTAFPNGRIQPYLGVGLGLFIARLETAVEVQKDDDTDTRAGFQGLLGFKYMLTEKLSLFAEYKFIKTGDFTFSLAGIDASGALESNGTVSFDGTSHLIYVGLDWHF